MNITVYCGSNKGKNPAYECEAKKLGEFIGRNNHTLIYGGSNRGLMGVVADNVLDNGGRIVGVYPKQLEGIEFQHPRLSDLVITENINQRRAKMIELGDVFVALPGGPGTLEEMAEVISLVRIDHLEGEFFILDVDNFYDPLRDLLDKMLEEGFVLKEQVERFMFVKTTEELAALI